VHYCQHRVCLMAGDSVARSIPKFIYIRVGGQIRWIYPPLNKPKTLAVSLLDRKKMSKKKRLRLRGKELLVHYSFSFLILLLPIMCFIDIVKIWTGTYDGTRTINEYINVSLPFLLVGLLFIYRQYRRLYFKEIKIEHSDNDFQHAIGMTAMELRWRTQRNRDGFYKAIRVSGYPPWLWGEMITIIRDNGTIFINSISDPNQRPTPSSFGWDRKNVRTFIKNLETIVTEKKKVER
jgi:hypothetical protein